MAHVRIFKVKNVIFDFFAPDVNRNFVEGVLKILQSCDSKALALSSSAAIFTRFNRLISHFLV